ncbi:uncharacterized protein LOC121407931 isoform X1 [Lytechinus variegatus]|uniref:uncharacterized protein LOC121407931 isoform X1 n=1 Tax=Lytechinus variegatus TaxID=7654 RepID=UPI001BB19D14|nr:uncharacterized protein LOC121407931 isoform X1 [Lytechinus variegatus]
MTLTITEAWIRDRVQLTHDNLEDVRSLSLPGTYQEKIGGLGNALSSFTRLKHIDLSRNALQSLQGLHHLKALEKLNLYYNNISSIQELKRLRHNTSLQEIDLRLNPVTKNEPDYRLYLVHMLPNLRKLDDRSVRESERKTALLHFDTDQAMSMTEHTAPQGLEPLRGELPRTKHVRGLGGRTAIEEDDSDLLDLLSRTNGDLSRPRPVTGSNVTNPSVDVQLTQDYQRGYSQRTPPRRKAESSPSSRGVERDRSLYQSDTETVLPELTVDSLLPLNTSAASDSTGSLLGADPLDQLNDSNLSTGLSPLRLPDAPLSHADPLTLHDDLSSQTDTNSVMDDLTKYSDLWQPSHSLLEERKAFEQEHKDLLSPTDTNSLINGDVAKLGKGRLSFSPVEERRKLDFDTFSEDSSFIGPDKETTSSSSSFSRSTVSQSQKEHVSQNSLSSATPRGSSLIKAGDIYTSIMSQTRISRARTRGRSRSASPDNSPLSVAASTGSRLTSPSRSPGTHSKSFQRSPSPKTILSGVSPGPRQTSPIRNQQISPNRSQSPHIRPQEMSSHNRPSSPSRTLSPPRSPVNAKPRDLYRATSPSTIASRLTRDPRPRTLDTLLSPPRSPNRISSFKRPGSPTRPVSPPKSPVRTPMNDRRPHSPRALSPSIVPKEMVQSITRITSRTLSPPLDVGLPLDQSLNTRPVSPDRSTRSHLMPVLKSPGSSIGSSQLSKESKKSVTFMLGSIDGHKIDEENNKEELKRDLFVNPSRRPESHLSGSVHFANHGKDLSTTKMWNTSLNRNNSNANEDSYINTSDLVLTPQENRYSNLVVGRERDNSLSHSESNNKDRSKTKMVLFKDGDCKSENSKSESKTRHSKSSNDRIQEISYSFSLHDDGYVGPNKVSQSSHSLHSSFLSSSISSNKPPPNMVNLTHANPCQHASLPVSLPDSPNPTPSTTSPPATNKPQGSVLDPPQSSDSNISTESQPNQRQSGVLPVISPHHVHHLLTPAPEPSQHLSDRERSQQQQQRSKVEVSHPEQEVRGRVDSNLKFTDESDAYAAYSSKVNFTPNPKAGTRTDSSSSYDLHPVSGVGETFDDPPPVQRNVKQNGTTSAPAMSTSTFLDSLLNLVDRYWNGTKSLHAHSKFQGQALPLVEKLLADHSATSQEHMDRLQLDVARYAQENVSLRNKLGSTAGAKTQQDTQMAGSELQRALDKSQRDVDRLCLELREVSDENRELQVQLQNARRHTDDGPSQRDVKGQEKLEQENEKLKVQLKHVSQLQELATMLQESHKSLVTTNDHLLKELEETKQRHMEEVKQLHWSYNQLKQTMDITMPSSHAPPQSTTTATTQGGAVNGYDKKEDGSLSMQPGYGSYSPGKKVKGFSYSNGSMYD